MTNPRVSRLEQALLSLIDLGGISETTTIVPNAEVINAAPADLPVGHIIVENELGYYVPAVLVAGLTVSNGDFVNLLYIKGTEIIAFQHGSGSGGGGGGGGNVWPKADENLLDGVNFATATLLIAAMGGGDIGYLGERTSTEAVSFDKSATLRGVGASATVFQDVFTITGTSPCRVREIRISSSGTNARGFDVNSNGTVVLENCEAACFGTVTSHALHVRTPAAGATVYVIGGRYEGIGTLPFDIYSDTNCTIYLNGPTLVNGSIGGAGDVFGWYIDTQNEIHILPGSNLHFDGESGRTLGVWLEDISTGFKVYYSTIAAAITAAAAGDIIHLEAGTYTGSVTLNKDVTLKGSAQGDTILTQSAGGSTLTISTAGAIVEDLTVINTRATGTNIAVNVDANARLRNVIAQCTGAGSTSIGIDISAVTVDLWGCEALGSGGTSKIGLSLTSSAVVTVYGGVLNGATYDVLIDTSTCTLNNVVLVNDIVLGDHRGTHLGVAVYHNTTQSISNNTTTVLAFNSERRDDSAFHDTATNNSRLTVPTAMPGWYMITGNVEFAGDINGVRQVGIQLNGATVIALNLQQAALAGTITRVNVSTLYYLAATNYVELIVYQNSGISLNINSGAQYTPEFRMVRVR